MADLPQKLLSQLLQELGSRFLPGWPRPLWHRPQNSPFHWICLVKAGKTSLQCPISWLTIKSLQWNGQFTMTVRHTFLITWQSSGGDCRTLYVLWQFQLPNKYDPKIPKWQQILLRETQRSHHVIVCSRRFVQCSLTWTKWWNFIPWWEVKVAYAYL